MAGRGAPAGRGLVEAHVTRAEVFPGWGVASTSREASGERAGYVMRHRPTPRHCLRLTLSHRGQRRIEPEGIQAFLSAVGVELGGCSDRIESNFGEGSGRRDIGDRAAAENKTRADRAASDRFVVSVARLSFANEAGELFDRVNVRARRNPLDQVSIIPLASAAQPSQQFRLRCNDRA